MAKSIRSKRMRKLRAFKRIRYGEKELARLKNMLEKAAEEEKQNSIAASQSGKSVKNLYSQFFISIVEIYLRRFSIFQILPKILAPKLARL